MNKINIYILLFMGFTLSLHGQKYITQTGNIKFFSSAPLENIEAHNNQVSSVINMESGEMAFTLLMKAFVFEKALMQEHFNEKYIESDKFPKSSFKGKIVNFNTLNFNADDPPAEIKGVLTIHGISQDVQVFGTLLKTGENNVKGKAIFTINLDDYNIKIPSPVKDNISKTIEITVNLEYEKMD